jgi:hypothetical protein
MNECIPVEQLGALKQLPADDPRRRHAASCPRCSSLLFAYQEFIGAGVVEEANPTAADLHLARFIETHVESAPPERVSGAPRPGRGRWFDFTFMRVAVAAAAVVLVAVVFVRWQPWESKPIVYRGESAAQFTGLGAKAAADGVVDLRWDAVKGADAYRVTVLARDLSEITRLAPASGLAARFDARSSTSPAPYYWQVTALSEGAEILTSDPQRLP